MESVGFYNIYVTHITHYILLQNFRQPLLTWSVSDDFRFVCSPLSSGLFWLKRDVVYAAEYKVEASNKILLYIMYGYYIPSIISYISNNRHDVCDASLPTSPLLRFHHSWFTAPYECSQQFPRFHPMIT